MDNNLSASNEIINERFFYQKIRKDLIMEELSVPVGDDYLFTLEGVKCKWLDEDDDESFVVLYNGKWQAAYSIDFE